jgi:opacity protein-like surface antigen
MDFHGNKFGLLVVVVIIASITIGCAAGSKGSYSPITPVAGGEDYAKYSTVIVEVKNNPDVALTATDNNRIQTQIVANLRKEYPNKFKEVNPAKTDAQTLQAIVNITKYDKGNAFARFMLAGLGGMHIDADITLNDLSTGQCLGKSECKKTFAWGGIYGGSTKIEDIEEGFGKAAAASIAEAKK